MLESLRRRVCDVAVEMERLGLVRGTAGNVSARDPDGSGLVAVTPTSLPYRRMTADDVVILDPDGSVRWGRRRPTSETPMHTVVLRERPDVGGLVHTHSIHALSFAVVNREIPVVHLEAVYRLGEVVPVARHAPPGTEELGRRALEALGGPDGPRACLLQNHGVLAVGAGVEEALANALAVEEAAHCYHLALRLGEPIRVTRDHLRRSMD